MSRPSTFFKAPVFLLIGKELARRYYLKGEFGSAIGVKSLGDVDTDPLRSFLGYTNLDWSKRRRVQVSEFATALQESAVQWSLEEFVCFTTQKELVLKADILKYKQKLYEDFLAKVIQIDPIFIQQLTEKQLKYWQKQEDIVSVFQIVSRALQNLPTSYTRLPVFAYQQTGNPHAFDENHPAGILLLQMLTAKSSEANQEELLSNIERKNSVLDEFYLLKDDINNDVAARGLLAKNETISGMWQGACKEACSWKIPLKEILRMQIIYPEKGDKVLVVENSGVYSILLDELPEVPMICSSGQFTYAVWKILRKLTESGAQIYYVGDMDPEGLVMAQQVLQTFPNHGHTIAMNLTSFALASHASVLSETRLKQLRLIKDPKLKEIANQIRETHQVALQEGFIEALIWQVMEKF